MELSRPRWSEDPASLDSMFPVGHTASVPSSNAVDAWHFAWLKLADEAKLLPSQRPAVDAELRRLQKYMGLRETAKHHLLRGYALIRRSLVELDQRFGLNGGVFFLPLNELKDLAEGRAMDYRAGHQKAIAAALVKSR